MKYEFVNDHKSIPKLNWYSIDLCHILVDWLKS